MNNKLARMFFPVRYGFYAVSLLLVIFAWLLLPLAWASVETFVIFVLVAADLFLEYRRRKKIAGYLQNIGFSTSEESSQQLQIPMPALVLRLYAHDLLWCNDAFVRMVGDKHSIFDLQLDDLFPGMPLDWVTDSGAQAPDYVEFGDRRYRVFGDIMKSPVDGDEEPAVILYFIELTDLLHIQEEYTLSRPVVSILLVDNYEELTSNLPDRAVSAISAALDDAITGWAAESTGILRRLERNRYLFIFEDRELTSYTEDRFSVLDKVRSITNDSGTPATLSIGVGREGDSFRDCYNYASLSIDMCLSRGGNQAVIKDRYNFSFFGGQAQEAERRTKVKSRVLAGSFKELLERASNVLIMGHQNADMDAVGSAIGVMCICRKFDIPAKIVINREVNAAQKLLDYMDKVPQYIDAFIPESEAMALLKENTLLVVVDTNRPSQVESRALLDAASNVAVIDHHRRAADYIENTIFHFHEPYASSASELLTELMQNLLEKEDVLAAEAIALLAGMVLDTKNFTVRTGSRSFEAAALLRQYGADTVTVKLMFQNDLSATLNRYAILRFARMYRQNIALCGLDYTADRVTAAQAADELLNISGIQASFVFYPDGDRVICSARSIGDVNAQMILEPLGGGGNQATAGAQITGMTVDEVGKAICKSIDEFFDDANN